MKINLDIKKTFIHCFWRCYYSLLKKVPWLTSIILIIISIIMVNWVQDKPDSWNGWGVNKISALAVSGSILASAFFFIMHSVVLLMKGAGKDCAENYYKHMFYETGIKEFFSQRGSVDISKKYEEAIAKAKHRIWAVGMSNHSFIANHTDSLINRLETEKIDIRVCFWDPNSEMVFKGDGEEKKILLLDIQNKLEGQGERGGTWNEDIKLQATNFISQAAEIMEPKGSFDVFYLSLPTNFSCLLIDDELFFFLFLSKMNTTKQPMLHVSAKCSLGSSIVTHIETVLSSDFARKHEKDQTQDN